MKTSTTSEQHLVKEDMILMGISGFQLKQIPSVIIEFPVISKKILTSKKKSLTPFWNEQCSEISSSLWLPTETVLQNSDLTLLKKSLNQAGTKSWFSTEVYYRLNKHLPNTYSISFASSVTQCTDSETTKSKLNKLLPTSNQKKIYKYWIDVSRYAYNWTMALCRDWVGKLPSWIELRKMITRLLPEWCGDCPFQIKGIAVKEAVNAFFKTLKNNKSGKPASFKFRSRKESSQSCYIPKSAIKLSGLYPRVSGKGLRYREFLPEPLMDSRLVWRAGNFYLCTPEIRQRVPYGENQARVCAIDPGVRIFSAFYSDDTCGYIGKGDFSRIQRLAFHLDDLYSRITKTTNTRKRKRMRIAALRMHQKIKNLVDEMHHQTALFYVKNFELILLSTFETCQMVGKSSRKIRSKIVRNLMTFAHYRFKVFLKQKAFEYGKRVVDVDEAYTSKTHPQTGEIKNIGSAKKVKLLDGSWINRDLVGARNILLRTLVDTPQSNDWQLTYVK